MLGAGCCCRLLYWLAPARPWSSRGTHELSRRAPGVRAFAFVCFFGAVVSSTRRGAHACATVCSAAFPHHTPTHAPKCTHTTQAAACELEEEAHLHEGTWHTLMRDERTVAAAGKYSTQIFHSYLVVDPVVKGTPRALDDGEFIEYIRGVSLEQVGARVCVREKEE